MKTLTLQDRKEIVADALASNFKRAAAKRGFYRATLEGIQGRQTGFKFWYRWAV